MNTAIQIETAVEVTGVLPDRHIYFTFENTGFEVPLRPAPLGSGSPSAAVDATPLRDFAFTSRISANEAIFVRKVFAPG